MRLWLGSGLMMAGLAGVLAGQSQEPAPATPAVSAVHSGEQIFRESGCSHCHQYRGEGGRKGPDLSAVGKRMKSEAIRKQVLEGSGAMPSFQDVLSPEETDAVVEFLHRARKGK